MKFNFGRIISNFYCWNLPEKQSKKQERESEEQKKRQDREQVQKEDKTKLIS